MSWIGRKRVAYVPTFRPRAIPSDVILPDCANDILRRVLFNPDPNAKGADRSFRAWLRAASSGLADIDAAVLPMQTIDQQNVPADVFESQLGAQLRAQGFDHAAIVMLGGGGDQRWLLVALRHAREYRCVADGDHVRAHRVQGPLSL